MFVCEYVLWLSSLLIKHLTVDDLGTHTPSFIFACPNFKSKWRMRSDGRKYGYQEVLPAGMRTKS